MEPRDPAQIPRLTGAERCRVQPQRRFAVGDDQHHRDNRGLFSAMALHLRVKAHWSL